MAEIDSTAELAAPLGAEAGGAPAGAQLDASGSRSRGRLLWDGLNEVVKSPVFVFFVGGSFIALLPRIEEWRLPRAEQQARAQEQQARADAALVAPFLVNLNANEQGRFRASAAALKTLEDASRRAHDGQPSPMFEGVNAAIEAVARQLWPPPPTTTNTPVAIDLTPVAGAAPGYGTSGSAAASAPPAAPAANLAQACVYIQVARDDAAKRKLAAALKTELDARAILAPGIQLMSDSVIPNRTQVRYFNDDDRGTAQALAAVVKGTTNADPTLARPALQAKPGTLEVWFGKD
jgi:hypothetical protein